MRHAHRLNVTLVVLVGLAVGTLLASGLMSAGPVASAVVLGLAVLKGRLILLDFLGLRDAHALWRGLVTAWILGVTSFAFAAFAARWLI
jgi:Prokaryotic Cytochrome C oxidase subunit IV